MNNSIEKLAELFAKFPGIGERQSRRFVYFLLKQDQSYLQSLIESVKTLKQNISECTSCHRFFQTDGNELCDICASSATDKSILMIVEKDSDLESIRKSKSYNGLYFILGGLVPIVEKNTEKLVRSKELFEKVKKDVASGLKEIILAFSLNPQGDNTDIYTRQMLSSLREEYQIKISSLGRGLSTGTELEYSDSDTIKNALKNRQ
ncbi:MAG: toprim domain-containing protein [Candidatus Paceibacterota bacterium]|jgi:recombination protein RecR